MPKPTISTHQEYQRREASEEAEPIGLGLRGLRPAGCFCHPDFLARHYAALARSVIMAISSS